MRRIALLFIALCLSLPAVAERKQSFGELDVHYIAFNSSFLQPEIAAAVGLSRGKKQGVLNISLLKAGQPTAAVVSGEMRNLLGQIHTLKFKQVSEGEAIYYLAQFPIEQQEVLRFSLTIQATGGTTHSLDFNQELFPD
ncbi:DUF4426 domain-containing protein [Pseudomonas sp. sp1636]|uniref:DUF4426 domain-containing protein n=1 Tax=Pseudomonas sp. sp1636 TaxID=3036707 RepID=UPI0025A66484|nr:DUF4426 domain-containing protein [Pseudomonas sp. sp1636]MDM8349057.1 DUF4426 domain-containing protein [Pseudomonas sp. sp1636]